MICFNPRSRAASDLVLPRILKLPGVSTHARARRATDLGGLINDQDGKFQPTLARGERLVCLLNKQRLPEFQPTLARGERPNLMTSGGGVVTWFQPTLARGERPLPSLGVLFRQPSGFNPRSRAASDGHLDENVKDHTPFQPTLARGERPRYYQRGNLAVLFQPTLARGERPFFALILIMQYYEFQPTLARGERP